MIRLALIAPIRTSLYSRTLAHLSAGEPGVTVTGILLRTPWTWSRITGELRRDGMRLVRKAYRKLVLGDRGFADRPDTLLALARRVEVPGKTLADVATRHHIPLLTVRDLNDAAAEAFLRAAAPDVIAFTGGGLVRKNILAVPRLGVLNCHMGILPRYRGMDVVEYPVLERALPEPGIGLTVHFMAAGIDTGPILIRQPLALEPGDTFVTIRQRLEGRMPTLVLEAIRHLRDGTATPTPQVLDAGRQYFVMHPRVYQCAERRLRGP